MIMAGLGVFNFSNSIQGNYDWYGQQFNIVDDYFKVKHFSHPFKLSHYSSTDKRQKLCEYFIQDKFNYF